MPPITLFFLAYVAGLQAGFAGRFAFAWGAAIGIVAVGRHSRGTCGLALGILLLGVTTARAARGVDQSCRRAILRASKADVRLTSRLALGQRASGFAGTDCRVAVWVSARQEAPAGALVRVTGSFARSGDGLSIRDAKIAVLAPPGLLARTRAGLGAYIDRSYRGDAPIAKALTIADQREIPREMRDRFADSGIIHMLSVSGLHVSIIAGALLTLVTAAGLRPRPALIASVSVTVGYVVLIGAPPPAVRSVGMCALVALTRLLQRPTAPWAVWAVGSSLSLVEPRVAVDLGWQLSVAGMAGLMASGELIKRLALPLSGWRAALSGNVVATAVAGVASAPLVAWEFGRVSLAALVTNLAAAPLFNIVQPLLFASILAAPTGPLAGFLTDAARSGLWLIDQVALIGSRLPAAVVTTTPDAVTALLLAASATAVIVACQARRPRPVLALALGALAAAVWWPAIRPGPGRLEIYVVDVGQGDAIALRSPRGRWLLIDAGGSWSTGDAAERFVLPLVRQRGGDVVHLVMTHPHLDHIGGAKRLLAQAQVDTLWDASFVEPSAAYAAVLREAGERGVTWRRATTGDRIELDGLVARVLSPDADWLASQENPNDASVVVQVSFGDTRFLFTGDAESAQERHLVQTLGGELASHVLKVGHHGSETSTDPGFLRTVGPRVALISVGVGNMYGHPSRRVLQALDAAGVDVLRTDDVGTIILRSDGRSIDAFADGNSWRYSLAR
jgi:competence protein ComEC